MFTKRLLRRRKAQLEADNNRQMTVVQAILWFHLVMVLQVLLLFGLIAIVVALGKVLMTRMLFLLLTFFCLASGILFIYAKAKKQIQGLRRNLERLKRHDQTQEISFLNGVVTILVESNLPRLPAPAPEEIGVKQIGQQ